MNHFLFSNVCLFLETQDDVEAFTNEIKKSANNARNKLKSQYFDFYLSFLFVM